MINKVLNEPVYDDDAVNKKYVDGQIEKIKENSVIKENNVYSAEEIVVGKWIDGKPLYRTVVDYGPLPNNDAVSVNHNITDIDRIVNFYGVAVRFDNDTLYIPYVTFNELNFGGILMNMNSTSITIRTTNDRSPYSAYITVEYTKTTD